MGIKPGSKLDDDDAISSVMFTFLLERLSLLLSLPYSRSSLAYWPSTVPSTSSSIALLSILLSSLCFTWQNHLNLIFFNNLMFTVLHPTSSSDLFFSNPVLPSYFDMYLNILWSQLASSHFQCFCKCPSFHSILYSTEVSHMHSKPSLFPLVEFYSLLASLPIPSIFS